MRLGLLQLRDRIMGDKWQCPECDQLNPRDRDKCKCGEPRPLHESPKKKSFKDGQCEWSDGKINCQHTGTVRSRLRSGEWLCREHYEAQGDIKKSRLIAENSYNVEHKREDRFENELNQYMVKHGLVKRDDETHEQYIERVRKHYSRKRR